MKRADVQRFVERLDAISGGDPEGAHWKADQLLREAVPQEIADAYDRLVERTGAWWCA